MERAAADAFFVVREGSITLTPSLAFSLNCTSMSFGHIPLRNFHRCMMVHVAFKASLQ